MKLASKQISTFLKSPDAAIRLILIYGPDLGLVRERLHILINHYVADVHDPFLVVPLDEAALRQDPSLLTDEAAQIPMMGGRKVVILRQATSQNCLPAIKYFLSDRRSDAMVMLSAGDLSSRDELRLFCERHELAASLPCYLDDQASLDHLIDDIMRREAVRLDDQARQYIRQHLGADHAQSRMELEKLALYAGSGQELNIDMVIEALGNNSETRNDDLINHLLLGRLGEADRLLDELWQQGLSGVAILRQMASKLNRLQKLIGKIQEGLSARQAIDSSSPKLFFREIPLVERQLTLWSIGKIDQALLWLSEAEAECKRSGRPERAITGRCLMQIGWRALAKP